MKEFWLRSSNSVPKFRAWDRRKRAFEKESVTMPIVPSKDRWPWWSLDVPGAVIQFSTNCKDIKGREIFEGDILKTDEGGWVAVVVFGSGRFCLESADGGFSALPNWEGCEVIGNVYENPELLKNEQISF